MDDSLLSKEFVTVNGWHTKIINIKVKMKGKGCFQKWQKRYLLKEVVL